MFRRFMIVCWVLVAFPFAIASVSWAGYAYYEQKVQSLEPQVSEARKQMEESLPSEYSEHLSETVIRDHAMSMVLQNDPVGITQSGYMKKRNAWGSPRWPATLLAAAILIWNIIWHIGHWVWMGRKSDGA